MPNKSAKSSPEAVIARIAARQHGVITRAQLIAIGLLPSGISDRVAAGRLHRVHRGVYAVGHPSIGNEGRWIAAVLACGEGAVLSHRSAAELWRMLAVRQVNPSGREGPAPVDVTVPGDAGRRRRAGIRLHRSLSLSKAEVTRRAGISVTAPARTLADLRRVVPSKQFAAALRQASTSGSRPESESRPTTRAASSSQGFSASAAVTASHAPR